MSRKYNIFIAASKELKQERASIKELASELNTFYDKRGIHLIISAYEDFEDNQPAYNNYITKKADLVIFVLKDDIGEYTENEFILSKESFTKYGHPSLMVFMQKYTKPTPETGRIEGLLKASGEKFYIEYQDKDGLKLEVRKKLQWYIEDEESHRFKKGLTRIISYLRSLTSLVLFLTLLIFGSIYLYQQVNKQPILIFAGGGSVANFIKGNTAQDSIDINTYPNSVYINLASGSAWALLSEEASRYMEEDATGQHPFVSICLSADRIDSTFINEKTRHMFKKGRVVEYFMGYDSLCVYIKKDYINNLHISETDTAIAAEKLADIINSHVLSNKTRLFTTSKNSGTLRLYQQCLKKESKINLDSLLDQKRSFLFYKNSSSDYINTLDQYDKILPFVILGSDYYYPQMLEKNYCSFHVYSENRIIKKPMYLYFVAYKFNNNAHYCEVRKPVITFLKSIHADARMDSEHWNDILNGKIRIKGDEDIIILNQQPPY